MIGYYVHNHGSGHRHRALAIADQLGSDVTLLGSLGRLEEFHGAYVELASDNRPEPGPLADVTASGAMHWVPLNHEGLRERHGALARWMSTTSVDLLVSDVSVEVILLARLLSVPPVAMAQRGVRYDRPHTSGYDAAVRILAPWPRATQHPWPTRWLAKTTWVGFVSRFDGRLREPANCQRSGACVVLLLGRGGHGFSSSALAEAAAVPDVHWHVLGDAPTATALPFDHRDRILVHGHVDDPWPALCAADVVVSAAGASAIADVAAARAPLVAVPQRRPFDEQDHQVEVLSHHDLCVATEPWPDRTMWPRLLDRARNLGGHAWAELSDGNGARRAATALGDLAARRWSAAASA